MRNKFNPWILWDRFQCHVCKTWWDTYPEYSACVSSHYR